MQIYLLISEFRIYASLTLRFAYKRVFVYMQLGYMQAILPVPSTCIYPSSTVVAPTEVATEAAKETVVAKIVVAIK